MVLPGPALAPETEAVTQPERQCQQACSNKQASSRSAGVHQDELAGH
jgi:hypothetical protein